MSVEYIGTKKLLATPMNRRDYCAYRGWTLPVDENGDDEGYHVRYADGYESWSPKPQFEESYQKIRGELSFNHAIELLKEGKRISRVGWNGKGMFLYLVPANEYPAQTGAAKRFFGEDAMVPYGGYIAMKTAQGNVVPWLASQTDILSDDWDAYD